LSGVTVTAVLLPYSPPSHRIRASFSVIRQNGWALRLSHCVVLLLPLVPHECRAVPQPGFVSSREQVGIRWAKGCNRDSDRGKNTLFERRNKCQEVPAPSRSSSRIFLRVSLLSPRYRVVWYLAFLQRGVFSVRFDTQEAGLSSWLILISDFSSGVVSNRALLVWGESMVPFVLVTGIWVAAS